MIDPIMVMPHVRKRLAAVAICVFLCACGGSQKSADTSPTQASAGAPEAPTAPAAPGETSTDQVVLEITTDRSTNNQRPFRVVVRAIDYKTFLEDTYTGIANMVMTPDDSVQATEVIYPGNDATVQVAKPEQDSLAVYFLFTNPDASWKTYLDQPVSTRLALDTQGVGTTETLPKPSVPKPGETQTADGSGGDGGLPKRKKLALVSGGVGGASAIVGTVFGLLADSTFNAASANCNANYVCDAQADVTSGQTAQTYGWIANVSWAVGAIGVVAGAVLWFKTPSSSERNSTQSALEIRPLLSPRETGVTVQVRF